MLTGYEFHRTSVRSHLKLAGARWGGNRQKPANDRLLSPNTCSGCAADGRGRDEDCSSPPAQIRTCGFPASGSCLRSNVIGLRGIGYPYSSDPWARCFSDMPVPALSPEHASQLTLPSTGRRPSTVSAADVTRHCSRLHRYYAAVRLLIRVHAHRSAVAFMGRSGVLAGHG